METILVVSVCLSISISAFCSLMEAALYAVPVAHVKHLADSGSRKGRILQKLKDDIGKPIAAILILNTISNTAGAAVAGAAVASLFGEQGILLFSIFFTLAILYFSEIIPKQIGVAYAKSVSAFVALPLSILIRVFYPMILLSQRISAFLNRNINEPTISQEEFVSMAAIGTEEGVLDHMEGSVIKNVIGLDRLIVNDILTPRVVVVRWEETTKLKEVEQELHDLRHTRIPLYNEQSPDHMTEYVNQRDLYREIIKGNVEKTLKELSRPLYTVPEFMRVDKLLFEMFEKGEHISAVVDEHGGFAGVVTLEDIIEEIVGKEIVDEYDLVSDLRYYAQILYSRRSRKKDQK